MAEEAAEVEEGGGKKKLPIVKILIVVLAVIVLLAGDPSPDGKGTLELCRGIEVGHIFQLRTKYSAALKCTYLDEKGAQQPMEMGCYGIGITRIVAAAIEQNHDERGIIWPQPIAPFDVAIVPLTTALYRLAPVEYLARHTFFLKQGERLDLTRLRDQLTLAGAAFEGASPSTHRVLLVESEAKLTEQRWHVQRAHFFIASMRRFADECRAAGWQVDHRRAASLADGHRAHVAEFSPQRVIGMESTSRAGRARSRTFCRTNAASGSTSSRLRGTRPMRSSESRDRPAIRSRKSSALPRDTV